MITYNGESKAILKDIKVYEKTRESLALMKILALSGKEIREGNYRPIEKPFEKVRNRIDDFLEITCKPYRIIYKIIVCSLLLAKPF